MSRVIELNQIKTLVAGLDLETMIADGFAAYSEGRSVVPPVGELQLEKGEVHIKYGFIKSQAYYVIKIASGFYGNTQLGLPNGDGCMLVFCQQTGQLKTVLLDQGFLTDIRTAVAGAVAAKALAPSRVHRIGIVGTGVQARLQLEYLQSVVSCRDVLVWGRSDESLKQYVASFTKETGQESAFQIQTTRDVQEIQRDCNLIVTTTPSATPLLQADYLKPGVHITAVGSDTPEKQELDSKILSQADLVVGDSLQQCQLRGEISQAVRQGELQLKDAVELGDVLLGSARRRENDGQITVADLTGVAVQDVQIASAVYDRYLDSQE